MRGPGCRVDRSCGIEVVRAEREGSDVRRAEKLAASLAVNCDALVYRPCTPWESFGCNCSLQSRSTSMPSLLRVRASIKFPDTLELLPKCLAFNSPLQSGHHRTFTTHPSLAGKAPVPPRKPIPSSDLTVAFLRGTGPGGQKINKTSSAVQLKHLPTGIVVKCQETRSQEQNHRIAMRHLQDKLEVMEVGEESRTMRRQELLRKRKASRKKKSGRKYKALAEGKEGGSEEDEREGEELEGLDGEVEGREAGQGEVGEPKRETAKENTPGGGND